jgi:hypothetical protein
MPTNNFPNIGKVTYGYAHNYFNKLSVTWTVFGANAVDGYQPDMIINLLEPTYTVIITNLTTTTTPAATSVIEYSFDGNTVHGELGNHINNLSLTFGNRVISTIWFRIQSGSSGPLEVSVQAWNVR